MIRALVSNCRKLAYVASPAVSAPTGTVNNASVSVPVIVARRHVTKRYWGYRFRLRSDASLISSVRLIRSLRFADGHGNGLDDSEQNEASDHQADDARDDFCHRRSRCTAVVPTPAHAWAPARSAMTPNAHRGGIEQWDPGTGY